MLAGGAVLFPSLALLFGLVLHGRFDPTAPPAPTDVHSATAAVAAVRPGPAARTAAACLVAGLGLLNIADARWAHAIGVVSLFAFVGFGFAAVRPPSSLVARAADHGAALPRCPPPYFGGARRDRRVRPRARAPSEPPRGTGSQVSPLAPSESGSSNRTVVPTPGSL